MSVCSPQHGLKQIKLCFNSRAGCEAALRSDRRPCLQSYYWIYVSRCVKRVIYYALFDWYFIYLCILHLSVSVTYTYRSVMGVALAVDKKSVSKQNKVYLVYLVLKL